MSVSNGRVRLMGVLLLMCSCCSCCLLGCGEAEPNPKEDQVAPEQAAAPAGVDQVALEPIRQKLVGSWLGVAYIDEAKLAEKLMQLDEVKRELMVQRAEHFISTAMAYQFDSDGTMTNEIEIIPPGGKPILDSVRGTWKVVEANGLQFQLRNTEQLLDGSALDVEKEFQFYEGQDNMAMKVPLGEVLGECNPLIVFERQRPDNKQTANAWQGELK